MTNQNSIIKPNPDYPAVAQKVIRPAAIRSKLELVSNKYCNPIIDKKDIQKITSLLLKLHTSTCPNVMERFQISEDELLRGMYCEVCKSLSVKRIKRFWRCVVCTNTKNYVHIDALIDYLFLVDSIITNKGFRNFVGIKSVDMASKILKSLNLPYNGERRHRKYKLHFEDLQARLK